MNAPLPRPALAIRPAVALVLLASGDGFAPGAAAASCGDYVTVGEATVSGGHDGRTGVVAEAPPAAPRPYSGPRCSGRTPDRVPPPAAPQINPVRSVAWLGGAGPDVGGPSAGLPLPASTGIPISRPRVIFHPPRPA